MCCGYIVSRIYPRHCGNDSVAHLRGAAVEQGQCRDWGILYISDVDSDGDGVSQATIGDDDGYGIGAFGFVVKS